MTGEDSTLLRLMEGSSRRFIIPVYQRNYDWKIENCKQLFDDLVNMIKKQKSSHFFGSIVSYSYTKNEIVLVDGQQRMTTVSLILIAMRNAMRDGACTSKDPGLCEDINEKYIIDSYRKDERKVRLKPFRNDCVAFDKLIFNPRKEYISSSKITINYNYFYDRITQQNELTMDELFKAISNLIIIDITLEPSKGDNPQLIFESLNSTGLDLTESDKIRNYILMGLAPDLQEKYYDTYWNKIEKYCGETLDGFVRNFLTIETGRIPTIKNIYGSFKEYANNVNDIERVLQDMLKYADAYNKIKTYNIGNSTANEIAKRLELLDMTVAYPFLMAFVEYADQKSLSDSEVNKVFSCIETFIFRRLMCDQPTNALNKIFANLHKSVIRNMKESDEYSSVMIYLLENRKQSTDFPRDNEFTNGFTSKNIYAMRAKNKEYIFERLENMSSKEKCDVVYNIEEGILTIEHIMPQTLSQTWKEALGEKYESIQEKWLHTISNLTLSGYNGNYSNRSFQEKKSMPNGFSESGLRLNKYIASFDKWTEDELITRKKDLSKMALEIWPYPKSNFIPEVKQDDIISLSEENGVPVGRKVIYFVFKGTRYDVPDWVEMLRYMIKNLYSIDPVPLYNEASNPNNSWFSPMELPKYDKLAEGLYFCPGGHGTWTKMSILKNLFEKYDIDEEDLYFGVSPLEDDQLQKLESNTKPPRHEKRISFWTEFIEYNEKHGGLFSNNAPTGDNWLCKSIQVPYGINMSVVVGYNFARIEIYFNTGKKELNEEIFKYLEARKDKIESEYKKPLTWENIEDNNTCRIKDEKLYRCFDLEDKTEIFDFLIDASNRMSAIFHKYILEYKKESES